MTDLQGKTILVTGSSRGIGAAIAEHLGRCGATVLAHYASDRAGAEQAVAEIPAERRHLLQADFSDPSSAAALFERALQVVPRIDVVVANAAVMPSASFTAPQEEWDATWRAAVDVNLLAPANLVRAALPHFLEQGSGIVIGLSSWAAQRGSGNPNLGAYAASKAGFAAFLKTLARAHSRDGVLTYLIAPGIVATDMSYRSAAETGGVEALTATLAMREWIPPQEIAETVAFLASGRVRHLSGATLDVNGATYIR